VFATLGGDRWPDTPTDGRGFEQADLYTRLDMSENQAM
jgi:hypothetical protein